MSGPSSGVKSPIRVHVKKSPAVNIHMRRKERVASASSFQEKSKSRSRHGAQKSPVSKRKPFIPPPGKTSPGRPIAWESKSHRLEINAPKEGSQALHYNDLSTSEDEMTQEKSKMYEKKISSLLNEMSVSETQRLKMKTHEQMEASRRLLEEQEDEIKSYRNELDNTIQNYEKLRRSVEVMNKEVELQRSEADALATEKDALMRKLVEVESEGRKASVEIENLRDSCRKLKLDKKLTRANLQAMTGQQEILLSKLDEFEEANKMLRTMLKQARKREESEVRAENELNLLITKLSETESKLEERSLQVSEQDRQIDVLIKQIEAGKDQARAFDDLQKTMEATRAHLQHQLRQRESDNSRMSVQIKTLQQDVTDARLEVEHLQGLLAATRDKASRDKDALKKATRIHRERANKKEESYEQLQQQLAEQLSEFENVKESLAELAEDLKLTRTEKDSLNEEAVRLRRCLDDLASIVELPAKVMKSDSAHLAEKLGTKVRHLKAAQLEAENAKEELSRAVNDAAAAKKATASKLHAADAELGQLRSAVSQYENLTTEYKNQLEKYRKENEDLSDRLRSFERESYKKLQQSMMEVEEVRSSFQSRILELQPYPELLKASEVRLQDAQERALAAERRATDHSKLNSELAQKVEMLNEQLETLREKYRSKSDDYKSLNLKMEAYEKKLNDTDSTHRELVLSLGRKDEVLQSLQERLEEQRVENDRLVQQLEVALADARRQADQQKEKALAKERTAHARILDLETQLSRSTQSSHQLKQAKEEAERKFNSRLQDMRDRLEQANSTTRSMQNYVQFLKSTYASVFSDDVDEHSYSSPFA